MIAVVVTAYKPDAGFASRFAHLLSVCGVVIVSDNTPGGHHDFELPPGFQVIHNMANLGLAPALNVGIRAAREMGASTVVLFDQDSTPSASFVERMIAQLADASAALGKRCCLGPTHIDDGTGPRAEAPPQRGSAGHPATQPWQEVTCLPTSGMVVPVGELSEDECFSDDFFLDLVDFEWCWRLRAKGWHFCRAREVVMLHRLGEAERHFLGLTFHVPAPYRHYFQVRDSLRLVVMSYVPMYSKLRLIGILPFKAIVFPFILDRGAERLGWMLRGVRDSLRGVRGIGAAATRLST